MAATSTSETGMAGAAFVLPQPMAVDIVASRTARTSCHTAVQLRPGMAAGPRCRGVSRSERRRLCNATSSAVLFFVMSVRPNAGIHIDASIPAAHCAVAGLADLHRHARSKDPVLLHPRD